MKPAAIFAASALSLAAGSAHVVAGGEPGEAETGAKLDVGASYVIHSIIEP